MKNQTLMLVRLLFIFLYALLRSALSVKYFPVVVFLLVAFEITIQVVKHVFYVKIEKRHEIIYTIIVIALVVISSLGLEYFL